MVSVSKASACPGLNCALNAGQRADDWPLGGLFRSDPLLELISNKNATMCCIAQQSHVHMHQGRLTSCRKTLCKLGCPHGLVTSHQLSTSGRPIRHPRSGMTDCKRKYLIKNPDGPRKYFQLSPVTSSRLYKNFQDVARQQEQYADKRTVEASNWNILNEILEKNRALWNTHGATETSIHRRTHAIGWEWTWANQSQHSVPLFLPCRSPPCSTCLAEITQSICMHQTQFVTNTGIEDGAMSCEV